MPFKTGNNQGRTSLQGIAGVTGVLQKAQEIAIGRQILYTRFDQPGCR
jgi:hypothetical protein